MGAYVENVLKKISAEGEFKESPRILELNGDHEVVKGLQKIYDEDPSDSRVPDYGRLLYDQAVLSEGSKIQDPQGFASRINSLLLRDVIK